MTAPRPLEQAWVSVQDAATFFGLSRSAVYTLIDRGDFPCRVQRMGKRILIHRGDMENLAEGAA